MHSSFLSCTVARDEMKAAAPSSRLSEKVLKFIDPPGTAWRGGLAYCPLSGLSSIKLRKKVGYRETRCSVIRTGRFSVELYKRHSGPCFSRPCWLTMTV